MSAYFGKLGRGNLKEATMVAKVYDSRELALGRLRSWRCCRAELESDRESTELSLWQERGTVRVEMVDLSVG